MGVSKKVGQDSEGIPIFKRDDKNTETDVIDHDLNEILSDYRDFENNALKESEYRFSVERVNLSETLCINPQFYLPNLNKTIKQIEEIDGIDGWSVSTLGQVSKDILIFKGPRIKTENLVVDDDSKGTELYYPPMSVLQEKSESAKPIDTSRASKKQLQAIKALRVNHGDILVTRSGTIGRVAYATKKLIGVIVSDDMIRVRIPDEHLRLYVYAYLQSFAGYDQMIRNEYGSVQQHLEAKHISSILIPIPNDWKSVENIIIAARSMVRAKEDIESSLKTMSEEMAGLLRKNIAQQGGADNITVSQDLP
ncbi:MAG TPA: restriction endonuclease subunit S [Phormidium sp.]